MDELIEQVIALEAALDSARAERAQAGTGEQALEQVLRQGELTAQRLDQLAAHADRLATRLRAGLISDCRRHLGAED